MRWWQEFILLHIIALLVITGGMGLCKHGGGEHCKYCSPIVKCSDLVLCPALGITRTRGDPSKHGAEATFHTFVIIAIERYSITLLKSSVFGIKLYLLEGLRIASDRE